jgi:succinate dehydrogenase/fumarate reductase cytochrome b subunit
MAQEIAEFHTTRRASSLEGFLGIYLVLFIVFLLLALAFLVCAQNWRTLLPGAEGARSIWDGVKSAVYTVISQLS